MSRLSSNFFTGGIKSRVQPSQARNSGAFVAPSAPTLPEQARPTGSSRRGSTFAGSVAGALPNASPNEQTFGAVQGNGISRDTFGRRGERAANQDISTFNAGAESANTEATAAKQAEIAAYEAEVARLNSEYESVAGQYTSEQSQYESWKPQIYQLNELHKQRVAALNSNSFHAYATADKAFADYQKQQSSLGLQNKFLTGTYQLPDVPDVPVLPDSPDPFVNLQQTKNPLSDPVSRRLASDQREIIGGSLPPQEATTSGSTFSQVDIPYRSINDLNSAERQRLSAPKGYQFRSTTTVLPGFSRTSGGQVFQPSDIGNETGTHFFIKNFGWVAKSQLTPLY